MIQRKQSLFLLLSTALMVFVFFIPMAGLVDPQSQTYYFDANGFWLGSEEGRELIISTIPLFIFTVIIALLSFISIFLYKNRKLQMRLCMYNIILLLGFYIIAGYYLMTAKRELTADFHFLYASIMPLVSFILSIMAYRGIRRDDLLIRGMDRIR